MQKPEIPSDEAARMDALHRYRVLDTPPEDRFDRITRIVADWLEVPISLVSLVDTDRQWFKSRYGLDATETPREYAFCAHAIHGSDALVVENALEDARFADNPLVEGGPEIRFYAGSPLVTPEGLKLGTLCAIDVKPRSLKPHQLALLEDLSRVVVDELELSHALRESAQRADELQRKTQELDSFAHALAHDLQGPLGRIRGLCDVARSEGQATPEVLEHLATSAASADELLSALRSWFEISGRGEPVVVSATECAEAARVRLASALEACGGTLTVEPLPSLRFFAPLLTTVFVNLIENAIKYRDPSRPLEVAVTGAETDDEVELRVQDNGLGIAPSEQARVFELLVRLQANDAQGSGMGLSICSKIVGMAGGSLGLESTPGQGSTFIVKLPKQH